MVYDPTSNIEEIITALVAAQLADRQVEKEWAGDDPRSFPCPSAHVCTGWVLDMLDNAFRFLEGEDDAV